MHHLSLKYDGNPATTKLMLGDMELNALHMSSVSIRIDEGGATALVEMPVTGDIDLQGIEGVYIVGHDEADDGNNKNSPS